MGGFLNCEVVVGCAEGRVALELDSPESTRGSLSTHADEELEALYARQCIYDTM